MCWGLTWASDVRKWANRPTELDERLRGILMLENQGFLGVSSQLQPISPLPREDLLALRYLLSPRRKRREET